MKLSSIHKNPSISTSTILCNWIVKFFNKWLQENETSKLTVGITSYHQISVDKYYRVEEFIDLTGIMPRQGPPITPQKPARESYLAKENRDSKNHSTFRHEKLNNQFCAAQQPESEK